MSTQKGNTKRSRPQKHQNHFAFKNNLHDTSHRTKVINSTQIANVCERCKKIIEWKIKYKKYKPLKAASKCNKCEQKTVKQAYHTMCAPCAKEHKVCSKCGDQREIVEPEPTKEEQLKIDAEMQTMLKTLPERKRRTFIRFVNKQTKEKKGNKDQNKHGKSGENSDNEDSENNDEYTRDDLISKLKSLMIDKDLDDDNYDSDSSEYSFKSSESSE